MPRPLQRGKPKRKMVGDDKFPMRRRMRRKVCRFCADKGAAINYREIRILQDFTSDRGKIMPSRITGTCTWHQRKLCAAIKRARAIALLPYAAVRV